MTSFIYQPPRPREEQQLNVISSMTRERQYDNVESAQKSPKKSLVLHQSSSKLKRKVKETNRDKGLTYSSKVLDFGGYDDEEGGRKDRSLKIDCSGPADIIADIQDLNYEYIPKKKAKNIPSQQNAKLIPPQQNGKSQKTSRVKNEQNIECKSVQKHIGQIVKDIESDQKLQQSWDLVEQRRKKAHLFWFFFFLVILLCITSHKTRQAIYEGYAKLRSNLI